MFSSQTHNCTLRLTGLTWLTKSGLIPDCLILIGEKSGEKMTLDSNKEGKGKGIKFKSGTVIM